MPITKACCSLSDVLDTVKELQIYGNPKFSTRYDDITLARIFSAVFGNVLRYNRTAKEWFAYDGIVWKKDTGGLIAEGLAKLLSDALYMYAMDADNGFRKFIMSLGSRHKRITMITDSRDFKTLDYEDLDKDPYLLNCINGTLNLITYELQPHRSEDLISKCAGCGYDPDAPQDEWKKFISEIMQDNAAKIDYLQRVSGYALLGVAPEEQAFIFFGPTTRNGKGTLSETLLATFGDYGMIASPDTLAATNRDSRAASSDVARLAGCRLLRMSEPAKRMVLNVELLKTLIGRDRIVARNLFEGEQEFLPVFKLVIDANYLPIVNDDTVFKSDRLSVLTFDRHFGPHEQDKTLKTRLQTEENLSAVLNWCVEGLQAYRIRGLAQPMEVQEATDEYRKKSDKIGTFIKECLTKDPRSNMSVSAAYELYHDWCAGSGYGTENKGNFISDIKSRGLWKFSGTVEGQTVKNIISGYRKKRQDEDQNNDEDFMPLDGADSPFLTL